MRSVLCYFFCDNRFLVHVCDLLEPPRAQLNTPQINLFCVDKLQISHLHLPIIAVCKLQPLYMFFARIRLLSAGRLGSHAQHWLTHLKVHFLCHYV